MVWTSSQKDSSKHCSSTNFSKSLWSSENRERGGILPGGRLLPDRFVLKTILLNGFIFINQGFHMRASRTRHFSNYSLNLSKLALTGPARTWRPTRPRCRNRHVVLGQHGLEITHELRNPFPEHTSWSEIKLIRTL